MSLQTKLELLIHYQLIQNIDLFHQGIYQIRTSVQSKWGFGIPYIKIEDLEEKNYDQTQWVGKPRIQDQYYYSQAVAIRYEDEKVDLNEGCLFRCEVDTLCNQPEVQILVEMLFLDLKKTSYPIDSEVLETNQKMVSKQIIKVRDVCKVGQCYIPLEFDKMHCALLKTTVTSVPLGNERMKYKKDIKFSKIDPHDPNDTYEKFIYKFTQAGDMELKRYLMAKTIITIDEAYNQFMKKYHQIISTCIADPKVIEELSNIKKITVPLKVKREVKRSESILPQKPIGDRDDDSVNSQSIHEVADLIVNQSLSEENSKSTRSSLANQEENLQNGGKAQKKDQQNNQTDFPQQITLHKKQHSVPNLNERRRSEVPRVSESNMLRSVNVQNEIQELTQLMTKQIFETSQKFYLLWFKFIGAFLQAEDRLVIQLHQEYIMRQKQFWSQFIISSCLQVNDLASQKEKAIVLQQQQITKTMRQETEAAYWDFEVDQYYCTPDMQPMVFRDVSLKPPDQKFTLERTKGLHLIVFVHGYKGGQYDLRMWKNALKIKFSEDELVTYCPSVNAGPKSDDDIKEQGFRMAQELISWMAQELPKQGPSKISFIAHSMGGLIVRSALPHLKQFSNVMYTYMTLGSPHLGFLVKNETALVKSGFWLIRKWHPAKSLSQLCYEDQSNIQDSFLFQLSFYKGLGWFKNLVFISANQDDYVNKDTSRIQRTSSLEPSSTQGRLYNQILNNIFKGLITDRVCRIDVDFKIIPKTWESMIGRAAHLELIDNLDFIRMMVMVFDEYFE